MSGYYGGNGARRGRRLSAALGLLDSPNTYLFGSTTATLFTPLPARYNRRSGVATMVANDSTAGWDRLRTEALRFGIGPHECVGGNAYSRIFIVFWSMLASWFVPNSQKKGTLFWVTTMP